MDESTLKSDSKIPLGNPPIRVKEEPLESDEQPVDSSINSESPTVIRTKKLSCRLSLRRIGSIDVLVFRVLSAVGLHL